MSKQDLVDELNDEYRSLLELVQDFGKDDFEKPGAAGNWTTRDVFAHLAYWNGEAIKAIMPALSGRRPDAWLVTNEDEINARAYTASRAMPLPKVMEEFRLSVRELVRQLGAASDQQLEHESVHKTSEGRSANAAWILTDVIDHLRKHAESIDIWLHAGD